MFLGEECAENRGSTVHGLAVHHPGLKHLAGRRPRRTGDTDGSWAPRGGASVIAHMSLLHCGISIRPMSALGHVWTAPPWQELSELLQHWSGAVMCPACFVRR